MAKIGVIGCGYWGSKHVRNFWSLPQAELVVVADLKEENLKQIRQAFPGVAATPNYVDVLNGPVDGVVIATPPTTHYRLAREALLAGKHVLVEKPFVTSSREAWGLVTLAQELDRVLMVGHTYAYHPAVDYLSQLIERGELGDIYYIDSERLNLGLFQPDVNVLWDLAPHDLTIIMKLLGKEPSLVSARGAAHFNQDIFDVAYLELRFPGDILAHVHVSWLDPCKVRRVTIVGSKKMVIYDDVSDSERIKIYDKGVRLAPANGAWGPAVGYRYGDVVIPHISNAEPLNLECAHFVECIETGKRPGTDGWSGLFVVQILEEAEVSMRNGGLRRPIPPLTYNTVTGGNREHTLR